MPDPLPPSRRLYNDLFVLGVPADSLRVMALLPLLEVAWDDGVLQASERDIIVGIADNMVLSSAASDLLLSWLTYEPSPSIFAVGRRALGEMVGRAFVSEELPPLIQQASAVARSTATMIRGISPSQRDVLERLQALADAAKGREATGLSAADLPVPGKGPAELLLSSPTQRWGLGQRQHSIGRGRVCDIQIRHDPEVSRIHAVIERTPSHWVVIDQDSARGLWVNGQRVVRRALLGGEVIELGEDTKLRFQVAFQDPRASRVVVDPANIGHSAQGA